MKHTESSKSTIYFSVNLSDFKFIQGNRDFKESKIKKLVTSYRRGLNMFPYCPIIVDSDMRVIDGQHRFMACKELKIPVYYVVAEEVTIRQIADLNNASDKWKNSDFLNCYCDMKMPDYVKLREFMDSSKLPLSTVVLLLNRGREFSYGGGSAMPSFRDGDFKCDHADYANEVMEIYGDISAKNEVAMKSMTVSAIVTLINGGKYDHKHMMDRFDKSKATIPRCGNVKEYLLRIEEVYNYRMKERKVVY